MLATVLVKSQKARKKSSFFLRHFEIKYKTSALDPMPRANFLLFAPSMLLLPFFSAADSHRSVTAGMQIDPLWLEAGKDMALCSLPEHVGICPDAHIECPNAGCDVTVARRIMVVHRSVCGREKVACPFCEERVAREDVGGHGRPCHWHE